ncbi:MAG: hypothetical protein ACRDQA_08895 [Nocardioidaceae bacterium]
MGELLDGAASVAVPGSAGVAALGLSVEEGFSATLLSVAELRATPAMSELVVAALLDATLEGCC